MDTSLVFPGLPISSFSLETIETTDSSIGWFYRPTSAITSKMLDMDEQSRLLAQLFDVEYHVENYFYGHNVEAGTPLYNVFDQVWFEQNGEHIRPIGAHYGNEIGFFLLQYALAGYDSASGHSLSGPHSRRKAGYSFL